MNRIDRMTAILLLLQGGKCTAGESAHRFEVSRRTIQRDIDALRVYRVDRFLEVSAHNRYVPLQPFSTSIPHFQRSVFTSRLVLS